MRQQFSLATKLGIQITFSSGGGGGEFRKFSILGGFWNTRPLDIPGVRENVLSITIKFIHILKFFNIELKYFVNLVFMTEITSGQ